MQPSPLQLEYFFLKELRFSLLKELQVLPDRVPSYDKLGIDVQVQATPVQDNPLKWRCELNIKSKTDPNLILPYDFSITYVGFFSVDEHYPAEKSELLARANAPAVLYSAARETLIILTSRGPVPGLILPSVTFIEPPSGPRNQESKGKQSKAETGKAQKIIHKKADRKTRKNGRVKI